MTSLNVRQSVRTARPWLLLLACAALGLAACSGNTGKSGPEGPPGPVGPPGPSPEGGLPVASAKLIKASIVGVTLPEDGKPVIEVRLYNEDDKPLAGLPAGNIRFVLARLEPGNNGKSSTWHAVTRKTDAFPGTPAPSPANRVTGTGPKNQANAEVGTAGTWTESSAKNGVYTYKFAQSLNGISDIPYDANLVHRVGLEIRTSPNLTATNIPSNNATFTWLPATGNAVEQSGREIVDNDTCNKCHDNLAVHGEARFDLQYCAMCHESYSFDAQSGNSIDLKVMIHKIHSGETLPSVEAGGYYGIFGYGNTFNDFSDVVFPQDKRNCTTCHQESDSTTPQASNYRKTVNTEACGSCHDNVNWTTGANHGGVAATNEQCETCHGPNSTIEAGNLRPQVAHQIPAIEAGKKFAFTIVSATNVAPGKTPSVTIKVTDPTNGNSPYNLHTDAPFTQCADGNSRLSVDIAWSTRDYTNVGSGSNPGQPIQLNPLKACGGNSVNNGDGTFTVTSTVAIPAGATGSAGIGLEGHPAVDADGDGVVDRIAVTNVHIYKAITDATAVARRSVVVTSKCDDCHQQLSLHGNNRTDNPQVCVMCHNPNATDINRRVAGSACVTSLGADDETIDFKYMIHAIHGGKTAICGYGNTANPFFDVAYPGKLNNCEGCHQAGTYYPVDPTKVLATTFDAGADKASPTDDRAATPNAAICSSCHVSALAKTHMTQNGGSFNATKNANGTSNEAASETCGTCHGAGRAADVKVVHKVGEFQYN
jgi:OmcA/MtrC family decaheme c-type cytochrome